jgi:hypothetical protein
VFNESLASSPVASAASQPTWSIVDSIEKLFNRFGTLVADKGVADKGVADKGVADKGVADKGVADKGVADTGEPEESNSTEYGSGRGCFDSQAPEVKKWEGNKPGSYRPGRL